MTSFIRNVEVASIELLLESFVGSMSKRQSIRELVKNGIEGITRYRDEHDSDFEGVVSLLPSIEYFAKHGVAKLSCVDNGSGMNPDELVALMGNVSSSGGTGTRHGHRNHGWGTKGVALKLSPFGYTITSLVPGAKAAYSVTLAKRGSQFGLVSDRQGNPKITKVAIAKLPALIRESGHGTEVLILGNSADEVTYDSAFIESISNNAQFFLKHEVTARFLEIPDYVSVSSSNITKKRLNKTLRSGRVSTPPVYSYLTGLRNASTVNGVLSLPDGVKAYWFIYDESKMSQQNRTNNLPTSSGTVGYGANGEIYSFTRSNKATKRHHSCGIYRVEAKVALMFDLTEYSRGELAASISRTSLHCDGHTVDDTFLEPYYEAFSYNMPEPIAALMSAGDEDADANDEDFLKDLLDDRIPEFDILPPADESDFTANADANGDTEVTTFDRKVKSKGSGGGRSGGNSKGGNGGGDNEGEQPGPHDGDKGGQSTLTVTADESGRPLNHPATIRDIEVRPVRDGDADLFSYIPPQQGRGGILYVNVEDRLYRSAVVKDVVPVAVKTHKGIAKGDYEGKSLRLCAVIAGANVIATLFTIEARQRVAQSDPSFSLASGNGAKFLDESRPHFWDDMADAFYGGILQAKGEVSNARSSRFPNSKADIPSA